MSIKVMTIVWENFPSGGSDLLTLLALADWSDDTGRCFPSVASIAKKTRLSVWQSRRIVHRLIDLGFVAVIANDKGGRPGATRKYRINIDRLTAGAHASPRGGTGARRTASKSYTRLTAGTGASRTPSVDASLTVIGVHADAVFPSQEKDGFRQEVAQ